MRPTASSVVPGLVACLLLLAGCGGGSESTSGDDPSDVPSESSSESTSESTGDSPSESTGSPSAGEAAETVTCDYPELPSAAPVDPADPPPAQAPKRGEVPFTIATTAGDLTGALTSDKAPCTVNSFASLAEQGFWADSPCHRLTTQSILVLQCGDPSGSGMGGPGYTIPDELTGDEAYPAGTLAMANTGAPNSGGSQYFLVYRDSQLPPEYTVFGQLDQAGLKVLTRIADAGTRGGVPDGPPAKKVTVRSVSTD